MSITVTVRQALSQDLVACAAILNDWIDETEWMPRLHSREDVTKHYTGEVATKRQTFVAVDGSRVCGFLTMAADGFLTALYVERRSRKLGIGHLLVERAKRENPEEITLYIFQANILAQAFYQRQGFVEVNRTTGDNDENLPDILMEWRG
jgi:ribosomal protein S18 acetylase RimI-like enzyme